MSTNMSPELLALIAGRFKVLSDPTRLAILHCLQEGELSVTAIVTATGASQPNVSKHLATLRNAGLVSRRQKSNQACFSIASPYIFELCRIVCGGMTAETTRLVDQLNP